MHRVQVHFTITSSDASQTFETVGTLDDRVLEFVDPTDHTNRLIMSDTLSYHKIGETILNLKLDEDRLTTATYQVYEQTLQFTVHTKSLNLTTKYIDVEYELYQDENLVNTTHFTIEYQPLKEDHHD
ncbi:DUF1934 family protein [Candidatus Xianfuyuplasma coldseepsis]|uniref:DUF1934 family protein n=1 Tax=Candidatus Xianfuyuplasma coldseepsis TaxID=2782163 RepID=A0A7L7KQB9_9MOLU|nr:DUF1934 family protein [Xianfuyuplasma coldseepsis]QMS84991.1 DUF1934 family protein [Xianfuyuplasma coldseepsis]